MLLFMLVFGFLAHLVVLKMIEVVFPCDDHFEVKVFCFFLISISSFFLSIFLTFKTPPKKTKIEYHAHVHAATQMYMFLPELGIRTTIEFINFSQKYRITFRVSFHYIR